MTLVEFVDEKGESFSVPTSILGEHTSILAPIGQGYMNCNEGLVERNGLWVYIIPQEMSYIKLHVWQIVLESLTGNMIRITGGSIEAYCAYMLIEYLVLGDKLHKSLRVPWDSIDVDNAEVLFLFLESNNIDIDINNYVVHHCAKVLVGEMCIRNSNLFCLDVTTVMKRLLLELTEEQLVDMVEKKTEKSIVTNLYHKARNPKLFLWTDCLDTYERQSCFLYKTAVRNFEGQEAKLHKVLGLPQEEEFVEILQCNTRPLGQDVLNSSLVVGEVLWYTLLRRQGYDGPVEIEVPNGKDMAMIVNSLPEGMLSIREPQSRTIDYIVPHCSRRIRLMYGRKRSMDIAWTKETGIEVAVDLLYSIVTRTIRTKSIPMMVRMYKRDIVILYRHKGKVHKLYKSKIYHTPIVHRGLMALLEGEDLYPQDTSVELFLPPCERGL